MSDLLALASRALAFLAVIVAIGAATFRAVIWPRAGRDARVEALIARVGFAACVLLLFTAGPRLWEQARALVDAGDPVLPMAWSVLRTTWGEALVAQSTAALLGAVGFWLAVRARRVGWGVAIVASVLIGVMPALMGHAIADERHPIASIVADMVHVLAAGMWIGALTSLVAAAIMLARESEGESLARHIAAFHPLAKTAVAALLASGALSAVLRLGHLGDLLSTRYGNILLVKIGLTAIVAGLGWRHANHGEAMARGGRHAALVRSMLMECAFAVLVIATTAVLVATSPDGM